MRKKNIIFIIFLDAWYTLERQQNDSGGGKLMQHPLTLLSNLLVFSYLLLITAIIYLVKEKQHRYVLTYTVTDQRKDLVTSM